MRLRTLVVGAVSIAMTGLVGWASAGPAEAACNYNTLPASLLTLTPAHSTIAYGGKDKMTATVYSGAATPNGNVIFKVNGIKMAAVSLINIDANNAYATWNLPKNLPAGKTSKDYVVTAIFPGHCEFERSLDKTTVTVTKAATTTVATVINKPIVVGKHPKASITVTSETGKTVKGQVKVMLEKGTKVLQTKSVGLNAGTAVVRMQKIKKLGDYTVVVTYHHKRNFKSSSGSDTFSVA